MDCVPLDLVYVGAGVKDLDVVCPVKRDCVGSAGSCSTHDGVWRSVDAQPRLVVAKRSRSRGVCSNQISLDGVTASAACFIDSGNVTTSAEVGEAANRDPGKANVP